MSEETNVACRGLKLVLEQLAELRNVRQGAEG